LNATSFAAIVPKDRLLQATQLAEETLVPSWYSSYLTQVAQECSLDATEDITTPPPDSVTNLANLLQCISKYFI
jgi:hypothetical protein